MRKIGFLCSIILTISLNQSQAKNLGVVGDVWVIQEQNLLSLIEERLSEKFDGKSEDEIRKEIEKRITKNILQPPAIELPRAKENSERIFDPSFTLEKDIADHKGKVFAKKGQIINPFDATPFNRTLIFINGDDEEQIKWFKSFKPETEIVKTILIKGNLKEVTEKLDIDLYFDQNQALIKRFSIKSVPTVIDEKKGKKLLRIREFAVQ